MFDNVFLALGANVGDRRKNIEFAIQNLNIDKNIIVKSISSFYETKPIGIIAQGNFYNCVIKIKTKYQPNELLDVVKNIEKKLGRVETVKWGPRIIDIDILFYDNLIFNTDNLKIPHPEFINRDFCIIPMKEIAKDFIHPVSKIKMKNIVPQKFENNIIGVIKYLQLYE